MSLRQAISVGNLLLDVNNFRIVKQTSQQGAFDPIIAEQGKHLLVLAKDIIENDMNPCDLPLVCDAEDGNGNYIVIEGNRRLTAVNLMLKPELAEGTPWHAGFKKLNAEHANAIPKVWFCVIVSSRQAGMIWIKRKHQGTFEGAGTEPWNSISQARADEDQKVPRPDLDAVNFVLTNPKLDAEVRKNLEGSGFPITTLKRLIESTEVQQSVGYSLRAGQLVATQELERVQGILTEVVTIIATGKKDGKKWTVRDVDDSDDRKDFIAKIAQKHPKKPAKAEWVVSAGKIPVVAKKAAKPKKTTPSTADQVNLIPKAFKLELPAGKVNDVFVELKQLDVTKYRHGVSVLFRVFFEFTLDAYIKKHAISLPLDKQGNVIDSLLTRLTYVRDHLKAVKVLNKKELKPFDDAIRDKDSLLSPETLNSYVHSPWMNPDPLRLKTTWASFQLILERIWT